MVFTSVDMREHFVAIEFALALAECAQYLYPDVQASASKLAELIAYLGDQLRRVELANAMGWAVVHKKAELDQNAITVDPNALKVQRLLRESGPRQGKQRYRANSRKQWNNRKNTGYGDGAGRQGTNQSGGRNFRSRQGSFAPRSVAASGSGPSGFPPKSGPSGPAAVV
jgi:hypothetical protein